MVYSKRSGSSATVGLLYKKNNVCIMCDNILPHPLKMYKLFNDTKFSHPLCILIRYYFLKRLASDLLFSKFCFSFGRRLCFFCFNFMRIGIITLVPCQLVKLRYPNPNVCLTNIHVKNSWASLFCDKRFLARCVRHTNLYSHCDLRTHKDRTEILRW